MVSESAYFFLGSPAWMALVDKDLPPVLVLFEVFDFGIVCFPPKIDWFCIYIKRWLIVYQIFWGMASGKAA